MENLDGLKQRAEKWALDSSDNIDEFSKSIETLKNIAEHRKILAETSKTSIETDMERKPWTRIAALAPAMAAVITGLTFGITFVYQYKQAEIAAERSEESQWRAALQKVNASDPAEAEAGTLAMVSFFPTQYADQSRSIATALCPSIRDERVFDFVVWQLYQKTDQNNQYDLLDIARSISTQLRSIYNDLPSADRNAQTLAEFLKGPPESSVANPVVPSGTQREVERREWELDTVTHYLYSLWTGSKPLDVSSLDVSGIIFWNDEPRAFDRISNFDKTKMSQTTAFFGKCSLGTVASSHPSPQPLIDCNSH